MSRQIQSDASYDIAIVGGGIGGAALASVLATAGARVLVCEQETEFRDRVRGEALLPWGVSEARALGLDGIFRGAGGREVRYWDTYVGGQPPRRRDLAATSPGGNGTFHFQHHVVQAALLDHARGCGAEVLRGAVARELSDGKLPLLTVESREVSRGVRARLVVVASGRSRRLHTQLGHAVREDPKRLEIAGLLLDHEQITDEATRVVQDMRSGAAVLMFPLGSARVRVYLAYDKRAGDRRLSGTERVDTFFQECVRTGVPAPWIADARAAGPLASFAAHSTWVEQPYRDGVVFIGDAAGTSDPSFGAGLSLTLRDVRVLRDVLLADDDWDAAARCYAAQRDRYFAALRRIEGWLTDIFYTAGPRADALRAGVLPRMARGAGPDVIGQGPDSPSDQAAYDALFGE